MSEKKYTKTKKSLVPTGVCANCGVELSLNKLRVFGEKLAGTVLWHEHLLWCPRTACYYAIEDRLITTRQAVAQKLSELRRKKENETSPENGKN